MTDQRAGKKIPEMAIEFDWKSGWLKFAGTADDAEAKDAAAKIKQLLDLAEGAMTESQIQNALQLRAMSVSLALRNMHKAGDVERVGRGERGAPFLYTLAKDLTRVEPIVKEALDIFGGRVVK